MLNYYTSAKVGSYFRLTFGKSSYFRLTVIFWLKFCGCLLQGNTLYVRHLPPLLLLQPPSTFASLAATFHLCFSCSHLPALLLLQRSRAQEIAIHFEAKSSSLNILSAASHAVAQRLLFRSGKKLSSFSHRKKTTDAEKVTSEYTSNMVSTLSETISRTPTITRVPSEAVQSAKD